MLRRAVAMIFVMTVLTISGACLEGAVRCGEDYCPIDPTCAPIKGGGYKCVAPGADCRSDERCGNGIVDEALEEMCDCGAGDIRTT